MREDKPCQLYRHFDKDGSLLYVGISKSALERLSGHKEKTYWPPFRIEVETLPTREDALKAELKAIRAEHPKFNVAGTLANNKVKHDKSIISVREKITDELFAKYTALAKSSGKIIRLYDITGLRLVFRATGTATWQYRYHFYGKESIATLGVYPTMSVAEARTCCVVIRNQLKEGKCVVASKKLKTNLLTVEDACRDYLLQLPKANNCRSWTTKSQRFFRLKVYGEPLSKIKLSSLRAQYLRAWVIKLLRAHPPSTVYAYWRALRAALLLAIEKGNAPKMLALEVREIKSFIEETPHAVDLAHR